MLLFSANSQGAASIATKFGRLDFRGAFGGESSASQRKSISDNRPMANRRLTFDDDIDDFDSSQQSDKQQSKKSSNEELEHLFMESLLKQKENQSLQNELLKLHKTKLSIDILSSRLEYSKKKVELETALELAAIAKNK